MLNADDTDNADFTLILKIRELSEAFSLEVKSASSVLFVMSEVMQFSSVVLCASSV